jgi:hypothetical protein
LLLLFSYMVSGHFTLLLLYVETKAHCLMNDG